MRGMVFPVSEGGLVGTEFMNPQLDDENPAELLAEGLARDVMVFARAFVGD